MRRVFLNEDLQASIENDGYVVIDKLLSDDEIRNYEEIYKGNAPATKDTFYTSHWNDSVAYRTKIDNELRALTFAKVSQLFYNYRPIYGYFLVKTPGKEGIVTVHQDWILLDESKFRGITVWIPLVDTNEINGTFQIIENSHKFLSQIRGSNTHFPYRSNLQKVHDELLTPLYVKKGSAIIFDHRLAHASMPNFSQVNRIAVGLVVLPNEAPMIHFYFNPTLSNKQVSLFKVDDDFLLNYGLRDNPEHLYQKVVELDFTNPVLPIENLYTSYFLHKGI